MEYFRELGKRVERRWRAAAFDDGALADIAADELTKAPAHRHVSNDDILEWCNQPGFDLPSQPDLDARFGDPPVTVFRSRGFHIDVNFWMNSTTAIHGHSFDGAFQVLSGSSVHTTYDFEEQTRLNAYVSSGRLTAREPRVLQVGDTSPIVAGPAFIHALFHLEAPSSTVVVRSAANPSVGLQQRYLPPGLALACEHVEPTAKRNEQVAGLLIASSNPRLEAWLTRYFEAAGPFEAYGMLLSIRSAWQARRDLSRERVDQLVEHYLGIVRRHVTFGELLAEVVRHEASEHVLTRARGSVTSPEQRFLLALLLTVPRATDIFRLVQGRFPERDPVDTVFELLEPLCGDGAEALGLQLNRATMQVARRLVEGRPIDAIASELSSRSKTTQLLDKIRQVEAELRASCLAPLLTP